MMKIPSHHNSNGIKYLATLTIVCLCTVAYGQRAWGIRVNQNTDLFAVTFTELSSSYEESMVRFGRVSASIWYIRGKYTHDVELFVPQIKRSNPQFPWPHELHRGVFFDDEVSSYAIRYTLSRNIPVTKSFSFLVGAALNPYYLKNEALPQSQLAYYNSDTMVGASLNLVPGISLKPFKRVSFVLDCPLKLVDFYHMTDYVKNPAIPLRQQKMRSSEVDFFMNAFTFRLGASYSFGG